MEGKIDLDLCGNSHLFRQIKSQSDLFVEIFQRLVEEFPQSRLLEFHHQSKGGKVSKGYRLENCPYEVLDLVRDFDPKTGFNIRILQWWGHGLYFFVQVGTENPRKSEVFSRKLVDFFISDHPDPWEYAKVLSKKKKLENPAILNHGPENLFFQIFKEIQLQENPDKLLEDLKREILLIMDNHN
jgi:hypothetical protein